MEKARERAAESEIIERHRARERASERERERESEREREGERELRMPGHQRLLRVTAVSRAKAAPCGSIGSHKPPVRPGRIEAGGGATGASARRLDPARRRPHARPQICGAPRSAGFAMNVHEPSKPQRGYAETERAARPCPFDEHIDCEFEFNSAL